MATTTPATTPPRGSTTPATTGSRVPTTAAHVATTAGAAPPRPGPHATTPPPSTTDARWRTPENVLQALAHAADHAAGYVALTHFDAAGKEHLSYREELDDIPDILGWLRSEVAMLSWDLPAEIRHFRVRIWGPGGVAVSGAKFPRPDRSLFPRSNQMTPATSTPHAGGLPRSVSTGTPPARSASDAHAIERRLRAELADARHDRNEARARLRTERADVDALRAQLKQRDEQLKQRDAQLKQVQRMYRDAESERASLQADLGRIYAALGVDGDGE